MYSYDEEEGTQKADGLTVTFYILRALGIVALIIILLMLANWLWPGIFQNSNTPTDLVTY